ncbi:MAG TPA: crosslink repair DNA glycosylase YcaQ family protein [Spirochaetia bacterium]|nr:crosslink repair DNA glycosylase YcaQ family protein [Spirochaetia bacterium]
MHPILTLKQARRLALAAGTGFHRPPGRGPTAVGALVDRIGFVQIDTISVVERAHHHVLAARLPQYQTPWLSQAPVFEYWAHAAAYLPWRDFRHTLPRKERVLAHGHDWFRVEPQDVDHVLQRIRTEGPLMARDFEAPKRTAGWWDWKPAKRALEFLFMSGQLMVLPRQGFQKVFDLTERVLPPGTDTRMPSPREHAQWYVDRALDAWALVARDEVGYLRREHVGEIATVLKEQEESGALVRVFLEGDPKVAYWVRSADLAGVDALPGPGRDVKILSPFDPLLIHRKRLKRIFGFDFSIECYVPAPKRTFGYFALPLLKGDTFVGLLDAKADRDAGRLVVKNLRYDGPAKGRGAFDAALTPALERFAKFNGVEPPST